MPSNKPRCRIETEKSTLIVFVKYPEPGKVKTRIARELGAERAAEIYSRIAKRIIGKVSTSGHLRNYNLFRPAG